MAYPSAQPFTAFLLGAHQVPNRRPHSVLGTIHGDYGLQRILTPKTLHLTGDGHAMGFNRLFRIKVIHQAIANFGNDLLNII